MGAFGLPNFSRKDGPGEDAKQIRIYAAAAAAVAGSLLLWWLARRK